MYAAHLMHYFRHQYPSNIVSYNAWIHGCLYHPEFGYYVQSGKTRVDKSRSADFYTAQTLGQALAPMVIESIQTLLPDFEEYCFVEIGPEQAGGILSQYIGPFPFASHLLIGPQDPLTLPKKSIVYMNELLDAQPFSRFRYGAGQWQEIGLDISQDTIHEVVMRYSEHAEFMRNELPKFSVEGYTLDISFSAQQFMEAVCLQEWEGLFLTFDYGYCWKALMEDHASGTARGYYKHSLIPDIWNHPGAMDITAHVCWDPLQSILSRYDFKNVTVQSQEMFLMQYASKIINKFIVGDNLKIKGQLKELLMPSYMGQKFQVLKGIR